MTEQTTTLLSECKNSNLKIAEQYRNSDGNLDVAQLMDDLDAHTDVKNDINLLKGMMAELEARVIHTGGTE